MATTQPGGVYIVNGKTVDAEGKPVEDKREQQEEQGGQGGEDPAGGSLPADPDFDIENSTRDELEAEAKRRNLTVTRAEGEGKPTVEDFRRVLREG